MSDLEVADFSTSNGRFLDIVHISPVAKSEPDCVVVRTPP